MAGNPMDSTGGAAPQASTPDQRETAGGYILLIEDDDAILEVLVVLLRDEEGYRVYATRSGEEALRIAPAAPPAFILMDARLPDENGAELVRALRGRPGWEAVAVILCSALPSIGELATQVGANAYLAKPFELDDLIALVHQYGPHRPEHDRP